VVTVVDDDGKAVVLFDGTQYCCTAFVLIDATEP
jgi:hypothetical protein